MISLILFWSVKQRFIANILQISGSVDDWIDRDSNSSVGVVGKQRANSNLSAVGGAIAGVRRRILVVFGDRIDVFRSVPRQEAPQLGRRRRRRERFVAASQRKQSAPKTFHSTYQ